MHNPDLNGKYHILVVDDEPLVRRSLSELLALSGYTVSSASNANEALNLLKSYTADVVIADIKMPKIDGIQLLKKVKSASPDLPVILITGHGSIESAVDAMKEGAYDYITMPLLDTEIKIIIERLITQRNLIEENTKLKEQLSGISLKKHFQNIVGKSREMQKIYTLIEAVSNTRATVLIHGETGTGKRLIAHAIHNCTELERQKPFIEVSCGALTETLLESELFGHVKGAFTGAIKDKAGRFELADGGTIFLDEIDAFSPILQVKLLRVLQEGEFERVGDTKTIKVDVRVIAATNQKLEELIAQNKFRKDLYYRLNIISIEVPRLDERKEDIPLLAESLIQKYAKQISKKIKGLTQETLSMLKAYDWPGNVRELENAIERAVILAKGPIITPQDLPECINSSNELTSCNNSRKLKDALIAPEKDLILKTLNTTNWNRKETAKILGINRTTLYKKMQSFGLLKNKKNAREK